MNTNRLMQDLRHSIQNCSVVPPNRLEASLALACNLLTNVVAGDLGEKNLQVALDSDFLRTLLSAKFAPVGIQDSVPLLIYGLMFLRTSGRIGLRSGAVDREPLVASLLDLYRASLPLGPWDDLLVETTRPEAAKHHSTVLDLIRPDTIVFRGHQEQQHSWLKSHGFVELPLYRSSLRNKVTQNKGAFQSTSPEGLAYVFQEIAHSSPPKSDDLFYSNEFFSRWICIPGAMLIYKDHYSSNGIVDKRWLHQHTTMALKQHTDSPDRRFLLSLGTIGGLGNYRIIIDAADTALNMPFEINEARGALLEIKLQKWVESTRLTIECTAPYFANLEIR